MKRFLILIFFGSFLLMASDAALAKVNPVPMATNSPYKNGINDSCGGCAGGLVCSSGTCGSGCTPNCNGSTCGSDGCGGTCSCSAGTSCSGTTCINTQSDINNCGSVGNVCLSGHIQHDVICSSGTCYCNCAASDACGNGYGTGPTDPSIDCADFCYFNQCS